MREVNALTEAGPTMQWNDVLYGTVEIPQDVARIVASPQFQRLKSIRQLGLLHYTAVLPTVPTRFTHCLGTYVQARKMFDHLEKNTHWLCDSPVPLVYRRAVEIAGLLHDIGHGPFSHTWETVCDGFNHERNGMPCVDAIFTQLPGDCFAELRARNNFGIALIKALIMGDANELPEPLPPQYGFIFEIVSNKLCKVDVDKWDYLKRDQKILQHLCKVDLNIDDIFLEARVSEDGSHVEYRYEDYHKIYSLFEGRWNFHRHCYRLPKTLASDVILRRLVGRCKELICGKRLREIDAKNTEAFLLLTDDKVCSLIKDDADFKYLENVDHIRIIDETFPENEKENSSILEIVDVINGPGREMPTDEQFNFFGDISEKRPINRNITSTKRVLKFLLN